MPATITISSLVFNPTPAVSQNVKFRYKKTSDTVFFNLNGGAAVVVPPNGILPTPIVIGNLLYNTTYTVEAKTDCGTIEYTEDITTPAPTCPGITDIVMNATN